LVSQLVYATHPSGIEEAMADPDFSSFQLLSKGRLYQDFEVGATMRHARGSTVGEVENKLLTVLVMNRADALLQRAEDAGSVRFKHWELEQDDTIVFERECEVLIERRSHWAKESHADE
jgi:hypothetical protein